MPRQRMVKPDFFDSGSLAECSRSARLAFIGLWVMGDDNGNVKFSVRKLKKQIFPFDDMPDADFVSLLAELERVGCIKAYEVDAHARGTQIQDTVFKLGPEPGNYLVQDRSPTVFIRTIKIRARGLSAINCKQVRKWKIFTEKPSPP